MENVNLVLALGGGVASFFSPCVLPMVPVYLTSLAGPEFLERGKVLNLKRFHFFLHSLCFVMGFSLVFTLLGAIAGLTGEFISPSSLSVRIFTGSGLILLGLYMLAAAYFPRLNFEKRLNLPIGREGYLRSFVTGAIFTFAWTPCVSPILGSIFTLALSGDSAWQGSGLMLVYSIGLGIPFLVIGFVAGSALPFMRRMARYTVGFYVFSGIVLVFVGILILFGRLNLFA